MLLNFELLLLSIATVSSEATVAWIGLAVTLIVTIGGWGTLMIKGSIANRESKARAAAQLEREKLQAIKRIEDNKVILKSLSNVEDQVAQVVIGQKELKDEADFEKVLENAIIISASQIVTLNHMLAPCYKQLLTFISNQTAELAQRFYYSPYRNDKKKMEQFLQNDISTKRAETRSFIHDNVYEIKIYKKEKYVLEDFLKEINVFKRVELLIMTLSRNGLKKPEVIKTFVEFIEDFSEDIIKAIMIWERLDESD